MVWRDDSRSLFYFLGGCCPPLAPFSARRVCYYTLDRCLRSIFALNIAELRHEDGCKVCHRPKACHRIRAPHESRVERTRGTNKTPPAALRTMLAADLCGNQHQMTCSQCPCPLYVCVCAGVSARPRRRPPPDTHAHRRTHTNEHTHTRTRERTGTHTRHRD